MQKEIPAWAIGLLIAGLVAVFMYPPWQYKPHSSKGGARPEFKGWSFWWGERPPLEGEVLGAGEPEPWTLHIPYLVGEIIGVCVLVLIVALIFGKKQNVAPAQDAHSTESNAPPST